MIGLKQNYIYASSTLSFDLIPFGGTGDFAWCKPLPGLFQAWRRVEPIRAARAVDPTGPRSYTAGSWGLPAASALGARDGFVWDEAQ
jgi:glucose-6-phosphate 1-dehydrogenase